MVILPRNKKTRKHYFYTSEHIKLKLNWLRDTEKKMGKKESKRKWGSTMEAKGILSKYMNYFNLHCKLKIWWIQRKGWWELKVWKRPVKTFTKHFEWQNFKNECYISEYFAFWIMVWILSHFSLVKFSGLWLM